MLGDMNAKVGNKKVYKVVEKCGASGVNENGERLAKICSGKKLSIGNTWFQKRLIQKYTREG